MATVADTARPIAWWKEPTKDSYRQWLARRPDRPQGTADDLDRVVFSLQFSGRSGAELLSLVFVPGAAWYRHGGRMACRRRAGDGDLAGPLARLYGRSDAGLVGDRVFVVERTLRSLLQLSRLARPADDRHPARPPDHLHPHLRQRAGGLGREPTPTDSAAPRNAHAAVLDFQARPAGKHTDDLPDDGQRLRHLLCELCAVRDPSAARSSSEPGFRGAADRARQRGAFHLGHSLGLGGGPHRAALGDCDAGGARSSGRVRLSAGPGL